MTSISARALAMMRPKDSGTIRANALTSGARNAVTTGDHKFPVLSKAGRKRKPNVIRDKSGKSRGEPEVVHPESVAVRKRELRTDGVGNADPADPLSGYSLGRLLLRNRQDATNPGSISQSQFDAGDAWCKIVHRHASIMGYKLSVKSPSVLMVGGGQSCADEPDEEQVLKIRRQWSDCYNSLMVACRDHGMRVRDVNYGIVVENWRIQSLSPLDYGLLRIGLNALAKVLK